MSRVLISIETNVALFLPSLRPMNVKLALHFFKDSGDACLPLVAVITDPEATGLLLEHLTLVDPFSTKPVDLEPADHHPENSTTTLEDPIIMAPLPNIFLEAFPNPHSLAVRRRINQLSWMVGFFCVTLSITILTTSS